MLSGFRSTPASSVTVIFVGLALVLLAITSTSNAEIHRAKTISSKPYHAGRTAAIKNRLLQAQQLEAAASWNVTRWIECVQSWMKSMTEGDRCNVWMYSLISAGLVGLSGIFPLLIIPLEVGEALKRGGSANNRLKLLLSFAVGGLLGDVFLHLLPESWAHIDKLGGPHDGSINIGCWILAGLLLFMIIEKVFPESNDGDDEPAVEETNAQHVENHSGYGSKECSENVKVAYDKNGYGKNGLSANGHIRNGHVKNGYTKNGFVRNGGVIQTDDILTGEKNGMVQNNGLNGFVYKNGVVGVDHRNGLNGLSKDGPYKNGSVMMQHMLTPETAENETLKRRKPHCEDHQALYSKEDQSVHSTDVTHSKSIKTSGWLNLMANVVDNFTHGLAVAGSYSIGVKTGLITTLAILLHEVPHEVGDFAILLRAGFDRWRAAKAQLLTATGGILGAVAALMAESTQSAGDRTAWILPFTAGGFIYIAMVTVLPDLVRENSDARQSLKQFLLVCVGIAVMAAVTIFVD